MKRNNSLEGSSLRQQEFINQNIFGIKSEKDSASQISEERFPLVQFVQGNNGIRTVHSGRMPSDNSDVSEERR